MRCPCVCCLCPKTSVIVFNPSVGAITEHGQSAKAIDPYVKSELNVEDLGHGLPEADTNVTEWAE